MAKDCNGNEINIGDVLQRVMKASDNWYLDGFNEENDPVVTTFVSNDAIKVKGYPQTCWKPSHFRIIKREACQIPFDNPKFLKGEFIMNKSVIVPQQPIKKIIFLYDNGRKFHASKIKKFLAVTKDIDGVECIEYSNRYGAHRVYRDDLAAITFVCEGGFSTTQELKEKVVVQHDNARMKKKSKQ